jgi:HD-GYP domain-containing protein (c-di-GMP phosphodiesterase class II)
MQLLKLMQSLVKLGEPLPWGVRDAGGKLLLAQGQLIVSEEQLAALLERGAYVDAEEAKAAAKRAAEADRQAQRPASLFTLWERALWQLDRVLRSLEEPGLPARVDEIARHIAALTDRDPDIAVYLCVRQDPKRLSIYGLAHAIHSALICLLVTRRLGWEEARTHTLMKAALTMNLATLDLQGRMAVQGVPPTQSQQGVIHAHPARSVELLRGAGVDDAQWLQTVAEHHERRGGGGYPAGMAEPSELAQLLRHVDVFMAKISPRGSRAPMATQLAARQLFQEDGGGPLSAAIIKEVGLYPPGELVTLKSGEHAVVVRRTANAKTPLVASITDRSGMPVVNTVVRDSGKPEFAIVGTDTDKGLVQRLPPERLYGLPE